MRVLPVRWESLFHNRSPAVQHPLDEAAILPKARTRREPTTVAARGRGERDRTSAFGRYVNSQGYRDYRPSRPNRSRSVEPDPDREFDGADRVGARGPALHRLSSRGGHSDPSNCSTCRRRETTETGPRAALSPGSAMSW